MPIQTLTATLALFFHPDLISWQHSGFHVDGGKRPVPAHHTDGRKWLAQSILRAPFSLQKITWQPETQTPETQTVIYRSKPHHTTKQNLHRHLRTDLPAGARDQGVGAR